MPWTSRNMRKSCRRRRRNDANLSLCQAAEAAFATGVVAKGGVVGFAVEIRPAGVGDPDLGIGDLPEQEVADPQLAGGANQQIGFGYSGGVGRAADILLVDGLRARLAVFWFRGDAPHGTPQLRPSAVVDCQAENHAGVVAAQADVLVKFADYRRWQTVAPADAGEADVLGHDFLALFQQIVLQEHHEEIKLVLRALPVFDAEAVEGQLLQSEAATLFDHRANALHAAAMAFHPRQSLAPRPATVAVHDDGDVAWQ